MTSGVVWRLKWRSRSSPDIAPSIPHRALLRGRGGQGAAAVRRRPRALREAAEPLRARGRGRGGRRRGAGAPHPRARLRVPAGQPRPRVRLRGVRALAGGAPPGRAGRVLRDRRAVRHAAGADRPRAVLRAGDAAPPAGPRRPDGAALPRPQDPRGRALPSLTVTPLEELRAAVEAAAADL